MQFSILSAALLSGFFTLATAVQQTQQVDVLAWPLSEPSPQSYARITYNRTHASIASSSTPSIPSQDDIIRIGYYHSAAKQWSGVATSASNFRAAKQETILLHLDSDGELYHIGFKATDLGLTQRKEKTRPTVQAEVVQMRPAPQVHMNKPVVLNADGQLEGPPEKTFLQKYWWAIAGVLLIQLVMGGGGGEEKK